MSCSNWHNTKYLKLGGLKQQPFFLQVYEPSYQFEWAHLCILSKLESWLEAAQFMMALVSHVSLILQQASLVLLLWWWWWESRVHLAVWEDNKRPTQAFKPQITWHMLWTYFTSQLGNYRMTSKGCGYRQVLMRTIHAINPKVCNMRLGDTLVRRWEQSYLDRLGQLKREENLEPTFRRWACILKEEGHRKEHSSQESSEAWWLGVFEELAVTQQNKYNLKASIDRIELNSLGFIL